LSNNGKQWKREESFPHQLFSELLNHLPKRLALKLSIRNHALVVGAVA
jgi:hypothetical protein